MKMIAAALCGLCCAQIFADGVSADYVDKVTYLDRDASIIWRTITDRFARVALDWPAGAVRGELAVADGSKAPTVIALDDTAATSCALAVAIPQDHAGRSVLSVTVTYFDGSDNVIRADFARLGLIESVGAVADVFLHDCSTQKKWERFRNPEVVQIPAKTTSFSVDDVAVLDYDTPGWHYLETQVGAHVLSMEADGEPLVATVNMQPIGGLLMIVR